MGPQVIVPSHTVSVKRSQNEDVVDVRFESEHPLNPLTRGLVDGLISALHEVRDDPPIVLTLRGGASFSCGAHTGELRNLSPQELEAYVEREIELIDLVSSMPSLTVAVVRGACIGNGAELALACDLRISTGNARFAWPEVKLGYPAPVERLAEYVGRGQAAQLALTGQEIDGSRAYELGLISELLDDGDFDDVVADRVNGWALLPRAGVMETKRRLAKAMRE